jgi:hypothetical protein
MSERKTSHQITWSGITIRITYDPEWMGERGTDFCIALLELEAIEPAQAKLPVTETGYRSHFPHPAEIELAGGPGAFVTGWLEAQAGSAQWQNYLKESRLGNLFG